MPRLPGTARARAQRGARVRGQQKRQLVLQKAGASRRAPPHGGPHRAAGGQRPRKLGNPLGELHVCPRRARTDKHWQLHPRNSASWVKQPFIYKGWDCPPRKCTGNMVPYRARADGTAPHATAPTGGCDALTAGQEARRSSAGRDPGPLREGGLRVRRQRKAHLPQKPGAPRERGVRKERLQLLVAGAWRVHAGTWLREDPAATLPEFSQRN